MWKLANKNVMIIDHKQNIVQPEEMVVLLIKDLIKKVKVMKNDKK